MLRLVKRPPKETPMRFLTRTMTSLTLAAAGAVFTAGLYAKAHRAAGQP